MIRFFGATFTKIVSNLEQAESQLAIVDSFSKDSIDVDDVEYARDMFSKHLGDLEKEINNLPLSTSFKAQIGRLKASASHDAIPSILVRIEEVRENLVSELKEHLFLCVPARDKWMFLEPEKKYWGVAVANAFVEARDDMRSCAQCLALNLWTASVFHSMRAVQHGLHRLANRLNVSLARDIDVLNWNEILQGIERKLKDMANTPKSAERDAEIQFASAASSHFFGIKEAWRNYVMHGRSTYDEPQARAIAANVRDILKALV